MKSKFDILFEEIIRNFKMTPELLEEYQSDCQLYIVNQPRRYKNTWIQIFQFKQPKLFHEMKYFAYLLDKNMNPIQKIKQVFNSEDECCWFAKDVYDKKVDISNQDMVRLKKIEESYCKKPHTRLYGFYNLVSEQDIFLTITQLNKFLELLNSNELIQQLKQVHRDVLSEKYNREELIDGDYRMIDFVLVKSSELLNGWKQRKLIITCPFNKLSEFNRLVNETLQIVRSYND